MVPIRFAQLPFLVKFSSLGTLFLGWVAFVEIIINRHDLVRFLPFYRIGNFCPYDVALIAALAGAWFILHRRS